MNNGLILSFSPESIITRWENRKETIKGTWLCELSNHVELIGRDTLFRVEVFIPFSEFETLKTNRVFQSKCEGLRRIRTTPFDILGKLLYSQYAEFDNDLDA